MQHTHQQAIINFMKMHNIPRRNRIDAVIGGCTKYCKKEFSSNVNEKAYLLGLILADFRRRRHGYQIDISTGTTHPAFTSLFRRLFEPYSPIHENSYFNKSMNMHGWQIGTQLHSSFEFLLEPKAIPDWVLKDNDVFLHFLAGYTDGEGILSISKNDDKHVAFIFAISSQDIKILKKTLEYLKSIGFSPTLRKLRSAGEYNLLYGKKLVYKKDQFMLRIKRKSQVLRLLSVLPIQHPEKVMKRELMFKLSGSTLIADTYTEWSRLRTIIKNEVNCYTLKAKKDYLCKNSPNIFSARE